MWRSIPKWVSYACEKQINFKWKNNEQWIIYEEVCWTKFEQWIIYQKFIIAGKETSRVDSMSFLPALKSLLFVQIDNDSLKF